MNEFEGKKSLLNFVETYAKELDYSFYKATDTFKAFNAQIAAMAARLEAAEMKDRQQRRIYRRARLAWLKRQYP